MNFLLTFYNRAYIGENIKTYLKGERIPVEHILRKTKLTRKGLVGLLEGTIYIPEIYIKVLLNFLGGLDITLDEILDYEMPEEYTILDRIKCLEEEGHPLADEMKEQYKLLEDLVSLCEEYDMQDLH